MKKLLFCISIFFSPLFVFAENHHTYDFFGSNSYPLTCPVYDTPNYQEGCSTEWKIDTKGCSYPSRTCKKIETPKCPQYPRPTFGKGCTVLWNTDTNGCSYMTETCTPVVKPEKNKCAGKYPLPTYGKGCTVLWEKDSEGCNYMRETCSTSSKSSNVCAGKYPLPTYAKGCTVLWEKDSEGCSYMRETCDGYGSNTLDYNKYGTETYVPYRYYYDNKWWYVYPENNKKVITVQGKKKINTISSCSSTLAPLCGKKKINLTDYRSFGTKNIEKYTEVTYESECELEKNNAEYLYPGECRSYSSCPLYKISPKAGCTTQRKMDEEGCEYPTQTCNKSEKSSKNLDFGGFLGDSNYWFQTLVK